MYYSFHGHLPISREIVETLKKYGAKVTYYCSAPTSDFMKVKLLERLEFLKKNYFDCIIKDISGKKFDYIFIINSAVFPSGFIKNFLSYLKIRLKFYMYGIL